MKLHKCVKKPLSVLLWNPQCTVAQSDRKFHSWDSMYKINLEPNEKFISLALLIIVWNSWLKNKKLTHTIQE